MERKGKQSGEFVPMEEVQRKLAQAAADKVFLVTKLILGFVERYGDEAWEIAGKAGWARGEWKAVRVEKAMKKAGGQLQ